MTLVTQKWPVLSRVWQGCIIHERLGCLTWVQGWHQCPGSLQVRWAPLQGSPCSFCFYLKSAPTFLELNLLTGSELVFAGTHGCRNWGYWRQDLRRWIPRWKSHLHQLPLNVANPWPLCFLRRFCPPDSLAHSSRKSEYGDNLKTSARSWRSWNWPQHHPQTKTRTLPSGQGVDRAKQYDCLKTVQPLLSYVLCSQGP